MIKRAMVVTGLVVALAGCQAPETYEQARARLNEETNGRTWKHVSMVNGPSIHTACVDGNKLILLDSYLHRENEYHLTSPKTLAVVKGGC